MPTKKHSEKDLVRNIYNPKQDKMANELPSIDERQVQSFSTLGTLTKENTATEFARMVTISNDDQAHKHTTYWVRSDNKGHFYDPYGMFSEGQVGQRIAGQLIWNMIEVRKLTFDYYLKFLQTKNKGWLSIAEREGY